LGFYFYKVEVTSRTKRYDRAYRAKNLVVKNSLFQQTAVSVFLSEKIVKNSVVKTVDYTMNTI